MEIKTTYAGLDLAVEPSSDKVGNENTYEVLIGSQLIITTKHDCLKVSKIILNSMEFIDDNL
jgi:hypothetical protein